MVGDSLESRKARDLKGVDKVRSIISFKGGHQVRMISSAGVGVEG